jgi:diadenosine tetraphosphate (Ap4A) HIT family hydrolase
MSYDTPAVATGQLPRGLFYEIVPSAKRSPGLNTGKHYLMIIKDSEATLDELPRDVVTDLLLAAYEYAQRNASAPGRYRVALNGPGVGTRPHAHIHIMLPDGDDKLPTIVAH